MAATVRMLATHIAKLSDPRQPSQCFTALGQEAFDYVDRTKNPALDKATEKAAKEAAYNTLRMIFDPKGFEG